MHILYDVHSSFYDYNLNIIFTLIIVIINTVQWWQILYIVIVSEHLGWVRNIVLIKCIFGSGKPGGVGISSKGLHGLNEGTEGQFKSNQKTRWMDPVTARRVPSKWIKGSKGNKGSKGLIVCIQSVSSHVHNGMLAMIEWYQLCVYT